MIFRTTLTIVGAIVLALGLVVLLNYVKFERTYSTLVESRFVFIVKDLQSVIETGLNLGLELENMRNIQDIIDREAARDEQVVSISVYDRSRILFHAGESVSAGAEHERLLHAAADTDGGYWRGRQAAIQTIGTQFINNFGQVTGGIALRYDRAFYSNTIAAMPFVLGRATALVLALVIALTVVSVFWLFRGTRTSLRRIRQAITALLRTDGGAPEFTPARDADLEIHYAAAEQTARQLMQGLTGPATIHPERPQ